MVMFGTSLKQNKMLGRQLKQNHNVWSTTRAKSAAVMANSNKRFKFISLHVCLVHNPGLYRMLLNKWKFDAKAVI